MKLLPKSLGVQNWKISENNRHVTTAFGCKFTKVMSLLSIGRTRRKLFLIPEHLNNYEIQYLWFPSVVYTYLNVNVFHYYLFEEGPSLPPPPLPVISPLSLLLIHRPSHPTPLFSATSRKRKPNTIFTFRIVMINKNRVWISKGTKSYDVIQRVKLYIGNCMVISEWGIHRH